jgi:hypothetical protein
VKLPNWMYLYIDFEMLELRYREDKLNSVQLFGLRCYSCKELCWGCVKHWFCGCCEECRHGLEDDYDDAA